MWDYDKLFAEGNILGIKNLYTKQILNSVVDTYSYDYWFDDYKNNELSSKNCKVDVDYIVGHGYTTDFEIQYIIRLDEYGNVVEKLFDREADMPKPIPKLEDGMFIRITDDNSYYYGNTLAYVDLNRNRIIGQDGCWCFVDDIINKEGAELVEIYASNVNNFNGCIPELVIWRSPEYQAYLNSKSN